jgi:AraC-like DNA-binding protein
VTRSILSHAFRHNAKTALGFEIFRLSQLFERSARREFDHALDTPQRHEFHIIYVGLRGAGQIIVDFARVPLGAGFLTFVARGRVQQLVPDRSVDAWMLMFEPEFLASHGSADPLALPAVLAPMWARPAIEVHAADRRELLGLVDQIDAALARRYDLIQPRRLSALLAALVLHAERLVSDRAPRASALERFLTIVERDHARTRSVAHYARASAISPRRLAELSHEELGKTPKQVIDARVVLEQKRLLAHTDVSIKELAARTGFDEATNLAKFFRRQTGMTPMAFRSRHRGAADRAFLPQRRRS